MIKTTWIALLGSVFCFTSAVAKHPQGTAKSLHLSKLEEKKALNKKSFDASIQSPLKNEDRQEDSFSEDTELFLTYEPDIVLLNDIESFKYRWTMLIAEALMQSKLQNIGKETFDYFDVYTDGKHFTPSFLSIQLSCLLSEEKETIAYLEEEVERLVALGITDAELQAAKSVFRDYIFDLLKEERSESQQLAYEALFAEYSEDSSFLPFQEFLLLSIEYLENVSKEEVVWAISEYFSSQNKVLESFSLKDLEEESEEKNVELDTQEFYNDYPSASNERPSGFSVLKRGHANHETAASLELFNQLRLTETDKRLIKKLVTTMADKNVFQLLMDKKSLEKKGKQIRPVHPMRFLGYICADAHMRKCLHAISKNHFKWSSFVDGFKDRMKEEAKKGQLLPYVPGFSQVLNVDPNVIINYINKSDYEGLMKHFI